MFDVFARNTRILVEWETNDNNLFNSFLGDVNWGLGVKWDNKKNVGMRMIQGFSQKISLLMNQKGKKMIYLITSVGQLNFFHWAMTNGIVDYCIKNVSEIASHYDEAQNQPAPENGKRRKLSTSVPCSFKVWRVDTIVEYKENNMILRNGK